METTKLLCYKKASGLLYLALLQVPTVMDAVKLKAELELLSGKVLIWERKISIAEVSHYYPPLSSECR